MFSVDALKENLMTHLDADQRRIATTRTDTGYRRVKGPAGSGKSLTLAGRAAVLAFSGKKVLVCSHNITLFGQLSVFVEKFIPHEVAQRITFNHFHGWCRDVCWQTGNWHRYAQLRDGKDQGIYTEDAVFGSPIPRLVSNIYQTDSKSLPYYDAILVDEGQDFDINWWQTLRKAIVEGGEMLLVADMTQNVRGTAQAWTDEAMLGCGFSGDWGKLKKSYRLPNSIIPILDDFLTQFPCDGEDDLPEVSGQTKLFDKFRWVQVPWGPSVVDTCIGEIERFYNNPDIPTVYFLSGKKMGMPVVSGLKQRGLEVLDTHGMGWRESRSKKVNFYPGCAPICATTVHSFKGWETPHLVVHVDRIARDKDRRTFYTALSRLNRDSKGSVLTVVSSCPDLEAFGRKHFPDFQEPRLGASDFNVTLGALPF